jgi:hypothetical protein
LDVRQRSPVIEGPAGGDYLPRSDSFPFAQVGVVCTTLYVAGDFPDYHRVGDEWNKIDYENMARLDRALALGLLHLASDAPTPRWNLANVAGRLYAQGASSARR